MRGAVRASSPAPARAELIEYLKRRFACEDVILTGSGTQALQLALKRAGTTEAAALPVAMPAFACYDLVSAAVGSRAPVVFYDVDPVTLAPDPDSLSEAIASGVRAVIAANLMGHPIDWGSVAALCRSAGVALIEDAAQGLGSSWRGAAAGSFGDFVVLSFGRGKGWTGGCGGALLVRRVEAGVESFAPVPPDLGTSVRAGCASVAQWAIGRPWVYWLPASLPFLGLGETHYRAPVAEQGIPAFAAAAVYALRDLAQRASIERATRGAAYASLWENARAPAAFEPCRPLEGGSSSYLRFPLLARTPRIAEDVAWAGRALGIARSYPIPLPELPQAAPWLAGAQRVPPGARELATRLLTVPTHHFVTEADVGRVADFLRSRVGRE